MFPNLFSIRLVITALCFSFAVTLADCSQSANNQPVNGSTTPVNSTTSQTSDRSTKSSTNQSIASTVSETNAETAVAQTRPTDQKQETAFLDGRYWVGHTGQGLQIEGDRYRYDDERGAKPWRSITELQAIKEGVIYDGNAY